MATEHLWTNLYVVIVQLYVPQKNLFLRVMVKFAIILLKTKKNRLHAATSEFFSHDSYSRKTS